MSDTNTELTILVVEDNVNILSAIRSTLVGAGYHVLEAKSGEKALLLLDKRSPDLILQDLVLSDMDGIELNKAIRKKVSKSTPIIALSGFLNRLEDSEMQSSGFTELILKPIDNHHLLEVVRTHLLLKVNQVTPSTGKSVLLVDDEPSQLKLIALHLTQAGYEVITATDGQEAFAMLKKMKPDVILSDILMPNMDGFELTLKVRQNKATKDIPVILLSSQYLEKKDQTLATKVGANAFLVRSYDPTELIKTLQMHIADRAPEISPAPVELFKEEHIHSLIRQLERQIVMSTGLKRRTSLQGAQLSLLKEVADSINTKENIDTILQNILAITLDAAGIGKGVLYLFDNGHDVLSVRKAIGFQNNVQIELYCGHPDLFKRAIHTRELILIPDESVDEEVSDAFLKCLQVQFVLLVPLLSLAEPIGVLMLGSDSKEIFTPDSLSFARALGSQIGQTVALIRTFEKVALSEKRYRTLMHYASCGIFSCDLKGNILEINQEGERVFGANKEDIIGKPYLSFVAADDKAYASALQKKALLEDSIGPYEGRVQQESGAVRDIEYTVSKINLGNEVVLLIILTDITERNRLRSQILVNDHLATVGTLAAGIVHEINSPSIWTLENLVAVSDYNQEMEVIFQKLQHILEQHQLDTPDVTQLIQDQHTKQLQLKEMIDESIQGASRIQEIVRNLKGFARIDQESKINAIDIHEVINSAVKMAYPEFKYYAEVVKKYQDNIPKLAVHSGRLHQVFLNLIVNAAQAIAEHKSEKNTITISTKLESGYVRIDIADTGCGIAPDAMNKIFEPFYTTKPSGIGTGIGLPIVKEILNNIGAEISVKSTVNKGTTFSIGLPLSLQHKEKKTLPKQAFKLKSDKLKVLIIDDEPSLLKTMQRMLELNHHVTTVLGGQAALDLLAKKKNDFDVLITDLNMPDVSGEDIYYHLSTHQPGMEHRMLFITGDLLSVSPRQRFLQKVHNLHVRKPFTREELLKAIDAIMEAVHIKNNG